jgi:peptidoglycan/xylan/chitin deacetylase (PgdA/CDA1 family)
MKNIRKILTTVLILSLFLISIILSYTTLQKTRDVKHQLSQISLVKNIEIDLSDIQKPDTDISNLEIEYDLSKFPSNYDTFLIELNTHFTQQEKTLLLLHGQSTSLSTQLDVTDGYKELVEKGLPILIPQEYINIYFNSKFEELNMESEKFTLLGLDTENYLQEVRVINSGIQNEYESYLNRQMVQYSSKLKSVGTGTELVIENNFLFDLEKDSIENILFKLSILNRIYSEVDRNSSELENLNTFVNDIVIYTNDSSDINSKGRLSREISKILFNENLNMLNNVEKVVHWKVVTVNNLMYTYPVYLYETYSISNENFNEPYDVIPKVQSKGTVRVPIMMYHRIEAMPEVGSKFVKGMYVSPEVFEEQLAYLVKHNYKVLTSEEMYNLLKEGVNPKQKSVMLTFDDSTKDHYYNAYPLLKKYGLPGIFYVVTSRSSIKTEQLKEMANNGMIIDSHSATHIDLQKENNGDILYTEIVGSRNRLKNITGQTVSSIAYPGCVADKEAYQYVGIAGYLLGTSCGRSIDHRISSRFSLSRVHVFNSLDNFKDLLSGIN